MLSPCVREALDTEASCHGCCPNPFLGFPVPYPSPKNTTAPAGNELKVNIASSLFLNTKFTNHESLPSLEESFSVFTKVFPVYSQTDQVDRIRAEDYFHLSLYNRVCFDYIGHGLFAYSQLEGHCPRPSVASSSSFPRPTPISLQLERPFFDISYRSANLNSWMQFGGEESDMESEIRKRIMAFMNISQDDYALVFTANESSAFKLLAESYPYYSNRNLLTVYDSENEAVQVMIERSKKRGARILSAEFSWPNLRVQSGKLMKKIVGKKRKKKRGLFVFPLQSRVTGTRYSYLWMGIAQESGWHVVLDATALGPKDMGTLGLSLFKPDFLICSFYKIFGENPSGFGCLFIKKSSASVLKDSTVASSMGIVNLVPSMKTRQFPEELIVDDAGQKSKLELDKDDITATGPFSEPISIQQMRDEAEEKITKRSKELSFSEIVELEKPEESQQSKVTESSSSENSKLECKCLDHADSLGLILISNRARCLINWLVNALMSLQHPHSEEGHILVRIYGPKAMFDRSLSVAFNVFDWNGAKIDPALVQKLADRYNISLSCGFLQHIWFSDKYEEERERMLETRTTTEVTALNKRGAADATQNHSGISVVTAALGLLTNFEDIYTLWAFVSRFLDADFVEKERWRYMALNQKTIEI